MMCMRESTHVYVSAGICVEVMHWRILRTASTVSPGLPTLVSTVSIMVNLAPHLDKHRKRELQLRSSFHQIGLSIRMWDIFLIAYWCKNVQLSMNCPMPGQEVSLDCLRKVASCEPGNTPVSILSDFCFSSYLNFCHNFPQTWAVHWRHKFNKPFPPQIAFNQNGLS